MVQNAITFDQIRSLDLVDYLASLGHQPEDIKGGIDYWYLSPFRTESEASFKVNRKLNCWYDHGLGKGGNLIDFGIAYFACTPQDFRAKFTAGSSFHQHASEGHFYRGDKDERESKIKVLSVRNLHAYPLLNYLHERRIPVAVASQFCQEVSYEIGDRHYFGIGFKNDSGGFEIRNAFAKCSSSPKDITCIGSGSKLLHVFEGFFDLLSFKTLHGNNPAFHGDILVLNSAALFEKARPIMTEYPVKRLWLDHDTTGITYTQFALSLQEGFEDASGIYEKHKDLNDFLTGKQMTPKQQIRQKIS